MNKYPKKTKRTTSADDAEFFGSHGEQAREDFRPPSGAHKHYWAEHWKDEDFDDEFEGDR
jgi:hypothetical protein